ncbi:MAG: RagB/SusD family nutrient uptake outer membrane protein [Bacteroidales bacterium]|nr:RagB/SusD family nutrient uptake outer membrane protein [Bacteroidales bacterium]
MKKIFYCAAVGTLLLATTSCEDMLSPESDLVMYEEDNQLNSVNDTLFSVIGVVNLMQKVADKTNLLGEVRGDLVTVTADATTDLQALANFTADVNNAYNQPQDYYAIINNCNYFIETADTTYTKRGKKVFEREMAVMHTFRAWAYLQLAINYGQVPFYTQFLGTENDAQEVMKQPYKGITEICNWLIDDLSPWATVLPLSYGTPGGLPSEKFFIPTRLMLGELCLWSGRYQEAAQWYHDFLTNTDDPRPITTSNAAYWSTATNPSTMIFSSHSNAFSQSSSEWLTFIPMESNVFDGTVSYLQDLYNSTSENYYFYELTYSQALVDLSASQSYYYIYEENHVRDTVCMTSDSIVNNLITDDKQVGDLRLFAIASAQSLNNSGTSKYNDTYQNIRKFQSDHVCLYRLPIIYLHYAEALNRAGFPTAAFAVLKYGLSNETLNRTTGNPINADELANIGNLITFSSYIFTASNTWGIHARGCGDVEANPEYEIPVLTSASDTTQWVEDRIIEELALEGCFEGQRYYDLLRVALRRNDANYLASRIGRRNGSSRVDATLTTKLRQPSNWYLPLRE